MLVRINKGKYNLVISDTGKRIREKGHKGDYSVGTEKVDEPKEYEEVE